MKQTAAYLAIAVTLGAGALSAALANAPERSLRPVLRVVYPVALPSFAPDQSLRPVLRPEGNAATVTRVAAVAPATAAAAATIEMAEPEPVRVTRAEKRARKAAGIGKVCRNKRLIGKEVPPVPAKLRGCGIKKGAIKLYEVDGVKLSTPAVMTCDTAKALEKWVDKGLKKSVRSFGGGAKEIKVAAGYSCRTRNNRPGAKISEHGRGKAIDISAIKLKNGESISVLKDWNNGKKGRILKKMHKQACGPFGTVLGPNADRYHRDHFHFDTAKHRGGAYCR
ncbi:extensin family protein [uncultured Shimia sp.]|uniref:extensin-like domain-containing protein n=1 Tax=uncultured Shimia sp. TaxID=573152 RepID=UPI0025D64271|nr:extensin family protein [uncultured Shimia sp.]